MRVELVVFCVFGVVTLSLLVGLVYSVGLLTAEAVRTRKATEAHLGDIADVLRSIDTRARWMHGDPSDEALEEMGGDDAPTAVDVLTVARKLTEARR